METITREGAIGIIGGMGPYAGLDLVRKIFDQTDAHRDQEHLPVALVSCPHQIGDRSEYLFGRSDTNPAYALAELARNLEEIGATVGAMPCNTAHAPAIFEVIQSELERTGHRFRLLSMIEETARFVRDELPNVRRVGVLSTLAVYKLRIYADALEAAGIEAILPDERVETELVNETIFNADWGIKGQGNPVTDRARGNLLQAIHHLASLGAEAVILGCTELPLAIHESQVDEVRMIDPTDVIARALIRETFPKSLKSHANTVEAEAA